MDISWRGSRGVYVRGKRLALAMEPDEVDGDADVVTLSRRRPRLGPCVRIGPSRVLSGPGEFDVAGVSLVGTAMGGATSFAAIVEDVAVCYLAAFEPDRLSEIGAVDVLVVPVGAGGVTVGQAAEAVAQLEPKVVVPLPLEEGVAESLCKQLGVVAAAPRAKVVVTAEGLPEARQVLLLEAPRAKRAKAA
jgi:hypothetical protein